MTPDKDLIEEWNLIVRDAQGQIERGTEDIADEAIVAMDEYVSWLESQLDQITNIEL